METDVHETMVELLFRAIPYIEEGEEFNKPNGKRLSTEVRNFLISIGELAKAKGEA